MTNLDAAMRVSEGPYKSWLQNKDSKNAWRRQFALRWKAFGIVDYDRALNDEIDRLLRSIGEFGK